MTLIRGASFKLVVDELQAMHDRVAARVSAEGHPSPLAVHRWRPDTPPESPALYVLLSDAPGDLSAVQRWTDSLVFLARVAVARHSGAEARGDLEFLADCYREQVIGELATGEVFGGAADAARLRTMRTVGDEFDGGRFLCMEFVLEVRMTWFLTPLEG